MKYKFTFIAYDEKDNLTIVIEAPESSSSFELMKIASAELPKDASHSWKTWQAEALEEKP